MGSEDQHTYDPSAFTGTVLNRGAAPYARSGLWIGWENYHLVDHYVNEVHEAAAIRTGAAIEDKSPLVKTVVKGPDAIPFVDRMMVRNATKIDVLHCNYTFYCDDFGHVVNEGITFRTEEDEFIHFGGGPMAEWFSAHADGFDVEIRAAEGTDSDVGVLCVQGPTSFAVMEAVLGDSFEDLGFSRGRKTEFRGGSVTVWRTGFTGEAGFELWTDPAIGSDLFTTFVEDGAAHGAVPVGNAAQRMARVEAGMLILGVDYRPAGPLSQVQFAHLDGDRYLHTPAELNFGRLVNLKHDADFIGRSALEAEAAQDRPGKVMHGVEIDPSGIAALYESNGTPPFLSPRMHRHFGSEIMVDGTSRGFATSMCWSPTLETMIGFAHIEDPSVEVGANVNLTWTIHDGKGRPVEGEVPARVVPLPFVEMKRRRN